MPLRLNIRGRIRRSVDPGKGDRYHKERCAMNWLECEEIEAVPGKMGGRPVVKGTRIEPDVILIDEEFGRTPEQTHESYPTLSLDTILRIRAFAHGHQLVP